MIIISYKDKYNKYEDLNITDFEDQIELLFTVNDQLVDGDNCVDIIANAETIRYILSIAMSELDYAPHKINMEKDDATYCLEMFDDGSLRVFLYDKYNDSLQGTSIYLYQEEVTQDIVDFVLNFYSDSDIWLLDMKMKMIFRSAKKMYLTWISLLKLWKINILKFCQLCCLSNIC